MEQNYSYVYVRRIVKELSELSGTHSLGLTLEQEYQGEREQDVVVGYQHVRAFRTCESNVSKVLGLCLSFVDKKIDLKTLDTKVKELS